MQLMTKEIEKNLIKTGSQEGMMFQANVIVKYFYPYGSGTWLITEGEKMKNGDWLLFGYCNITEWEWGEVLLSEIQSIPGMERDLHCGIQTVEQHLKEFGIEVQKEAIS